jgi:phospholipase A-2-activating protein
VLAIPNSNLIISGALVDVVYSAVSYSMCASASADKTIRLWRDGKLESIVRGHTDAGTVFPLSSCSSALSLLVRGLVSVPGIGFASASNDTTIRLWSLAGQQLQEMYNIHKRRFMNLGS